MLKVGEINEWRPIGWRFAFVLKIR
jgi:hypothetical protein